MAPNSKIIMIRHGEALHNVHNEFSLHDPQLTPLGQEQCQKLLHNAFAAGEWKDFSKLNLIVISPLHRTLETGLSAFGEQIDNGVMTIILPELQETSNRPCDTGKKTEELTSLFPNLDFTDLIRTSTWLYKLTGFYAPANLKMRAAWVRKWLYERPEEYIAVVTHSGFLRWLTPQYFPFTENRDSYRNCEYREFTFIDLPHDNGDGSPYRMVETAWSKELRFEKRAEPQMLISVDGEAVKASSLGESPGICPVGGGVVAGGIDGEVCEVNGGVEIHVSDEEEGEGMGAEGSSGPLVF